MILELELRPETEARLKQLAQTRGLDFRETAQLALERWTLQELDPEAAFDQLLAQIGDPRAEAGLPPLTAEELTRGSFYED